MIGVELDENDEQVKLAENVANGILGKIFLKQCFAFKLYSFILVYMPGMAEGLKICSNTACRRCFLICQNLGGVCPPPPFPPTVQCVEMGF